MTYKYSKKDGWIGFCDDCKFPFKPIYVRVYTPTFQLIDNMKDFNKYKNHEFQGHCGCYSPAGSGINFEFKVMKHGNRLIWSDMFCVVVDGVIVI